MNNINHLSETSKFIFFKIKAFGDCIGKGVTKSFLNSQ